MSSNLWNLVPHSLTPHQKSRQLNPPEQLEKRDWDEFKKRIDAQFESCIASLQEYLNSPSLLNSFYNSKEHKELNTTVNSFSPDEKLVYEEIEHRLKEKKINLDEVKKIIISEEEVTQFINYWFTKETSQKAVEILKSAGLGAGFLSANDHTDIWTHLKS